MKLILNSEVINYFDEDSKKNYLVIPEEGKIFELNETSKVIMDSLETETTIEQIVENIVGVFSANEIDADMVLKDVKSFVTSLINNSFVYTL